MKRLLSLILLISVYSHAQQKVKVDLSNPNATIYTHLYFLQPESYDASKAALTLHGISKKEAINKAKKIKEILDGKGLVVDFSKVPTDPNFVDTISYKLNNLEKLKHQYVLFPNKLPEVYVEKIGSNWYYSKETINSIDKIYKETFPWDFPLIHKNFPTLFEKKINGIPIWKPIGLLFIIFLSFFLYYILIPIIYYILKKLQGLIIDREVHQDLFDLLREIARIYVFIIIIDVIEKLFPSLQFVKVNPIFFLGLDIFKTVFWISLILKIVDYSFAISYYSKKFKRSLLDEQLEPILRKLFNWVVIFIGFLRILTLFGVDAKAVLAGASIGGVAVAFAAQDTVKNLFGTLSIFLDKPFRIGDWVEINKEVSGTVEVVGFRSTRVRAADTSIFQIPNSTISNAVVNNMGLRTYRRYNTELGIKYDTPPELIEAFVQGIRNIIIAHPDTRSESYNVEFTKFGDSALKILINVFFKKLDWGYEQSSKHRLHIAIVKLAAALGVQFAFPSSTLMIEQFPGQESLAAKYNTNKKDIENSIKSVLEEFEAIDHNFDTKGSNLPPD